jgi:hypothetical protein
MQKEARAPRVTVFACCKVCSSAGFADGALGSDIPEMAVVYLMYHCVWKHRDALASRTCLNVSSAPLDETIAERLVGAVTPVTLELALAAQTSLEERNRQIGTMADANLPSSLRSRARGTALRSDRSGQPPDRGDAGTTPCNACRISRPNWPPSSVGPCGPSQPSRRNRFFSWQATSRDSGGRQRPVTKGPEPKVVRLHVRWQGGATETLQLQLPPNRADMVRYPEALWRASGN